MVESLKWWYEYHREDYAAVRERLAACRNVMLHGRREAAERMLRLSCINAVLSIQTERKRHERAFTAYATGTRLDTAAEQTVYGNQKARWLETALGTYDFNECIQWLRDHGPDAALSHLVDNFKGLSWVKAGFALAMVGVWELACPDTRCRQFLEIDERIRTEGDYRDALDAIDQSLDADIPLFIKQWAMYDFMAKEHADHLPFYTEVLYVGE